MPTLPTGVLMDTRDARRRAISYGIVLLLAALGAMGAIGWVFQRGISPVEVTAFFLFYFLSSVGQGIGLHRYFSHKSFATSRSGRRLLAILAIMSMQGPIVAWVADHRRHHAHTDRCGDVHSPSIDGRCAPLRGMRGLWHAQIGWVFDGSYSDPKIFASDICADPFLRALDQTRLAWYALSILVLPAVFGWLVGGSDHILSTVLIAGFFRAFLFSQSILALNSFGHTFGTRRFKQTNTSTNNAWVALVTLGEGWHNNHHRFPRSAHNGYAWYEWDPLGAIIRVCGWLGLVWNIHRMPQRDRHLASAPTE